MTKNDIVTVKIESITNEGFGVGRYEGMVVFVPFSAVGDTLSVRILKVNKSHSFGKIEEIIEPSEDRIAHDCPVFGKCGGCSFRHISYEAELEAKDGFIRDAFIRIGKLSPEFLPIIGNCIINEYRNKAQYPVGKDKEGRTVCGFYADRSHRIIPCESCRLEKKVFADIRKAVLGYTEKYKISVYNEEQHNGVLRHICIREGYHSGEINVTLVVRRNVPELKKLARELSADFPAIKGIVANINKEKTNVIYANEEIVLFGEKNITDTMCDKTFTISPKSFYQVNTPMAEVLYRKASELAEPDGKTVIDLYCGAGTIGLSMSDRAEKVIGVEIVESAVENAKENAKLNSADNVTFYCGDAGKITDKLKSDGITADVVIVDPARKGCDERTLNNIVSFNPERIVMISCNPVTAARDSAYLTQNGYRIRTVQGVDLFSRTTHVECIVLFERTEGIL